MEVNKQIRRRVLMGHVQQLPRGGLMQLGNDRTQLYFNQIFCNFLRFFAKLRDFFPPIWKKEDCLLDK